MYKYVDHVLASYLSADAGQSEEEAIAALKNHIANSVEFASGFRMELHQALENQDFSWKDALAEHDVLFTDSEQKARDYIIRLLWNGLFH